MVMYGSSIFFICKTDQLLQQPAVLGHAFPGTGQYAVAGGMSTAGSLTRWFRDNFAPSEVEAESGRRAQTPMPRWPNWPLRRRPARTG